MTLDKVFDGKRPAKLGTRLRPAQLSVKTDKRRDELAAVCEENGWDCEIEVDPDQPENTDDLDLLKNPISPARAEPKAGRNDPCPCGSGKKFKKCCGK